MSGCPTGDEDGRGQSRLRGRGGQRLRVRKTFGPRVAHVGVDATVPAFGPLRQNEGPRARTMRQLLGRRYCTDLSAQQRRPVQRIGPHKTCCSMPTTTRIAAASSTCTRAGVHADSVPACLFLPAKARAVPPTRIMAHGWCRVHSRIRSVRPAPPPPPTARDESLASLQRSGPSAVFTNCAPVWASDLKVGGCSCSAGGTRPMLECRHRLFHQTTQAMIANSTSLMVVTGPLMKGPGARGAPPARGASAARLDHAQCRRPLDLQRRHRCTRVRDHPVRGLARGPDGRPLPARPASWSGGGGRRAALVCAPDRGRRRPAGLRRHRPGRRGGPARGAGRGRDPHGERGLAADAHPDAGHVHVPAGARRRGRARPGRRRAALARERSARHRPVAQRAARRRRRRLVCEGRGRWALRAVGTGDRGPARAWAPAHRRHGRRPPRRSAGVAGRAVTAVPRVRAGGSGVELRLRRRHRAARGPGPYPARRGPLGTSGCSSRRWVSAGCSVL